MKQVITSSILSIFLTMSCTNNSQPTAESKISIITLDPGHFHAALVQKSMYPDVDSTVHVYAPAGQDLNFHLDRVKSYNSRAENPTRWKQEVYTGNDFFEKMLSEKKGNVVVLSGNNQKKTDYILQSLDNGFNVLADKPMVIDSSGFRKLEKAFETAAKNKLLLYDIMTERFEINTVLQRELSMIPEVFGVLEKGTESNPAITKESVHHFYKYVSGAVLTRPTWFLDAKQQGEGIVDVTTHLVDLVQWQAFPEQALDYKKDIVVLTGKRWPTNMSHADFVAITKWNDSTGKQYPDFLNGNVTKDGSLDIFSNGEINYAVRGIHARVSVIWKYKAPEGSGDTHFSMMRGTKASLIIRQGADESFKPALYLEPVAADAGYENVLVSKFSELQKKYPGIDLQKKTKGWKVVIPEKYNDGHEAHFASVTKKFLEYLSNKTLPAWEVPNMLAKYYTTTQGLSSSLKK